MNNKLHLNNLAETITYQEVMDLLSAHGNVADLNLPVDRISGRPLGFGFVTMATPEGARSAIEALNGRTIGARILTVGAAAAPGTGRNPRRSARLLF